MRKLQSLLILIILTALFITLLLSVFNTCSLPKQGFIELPKINKNDQIISHFAYQLKFNPETRQADWIAYELELHELESSFERTDKFREDPMLPGKTASLEDYKGSGYDRGHLAPAADMSWNEQAMEESFFLSNISPQIPNFNRGIWKQLENYARDICQYYACVYIVTGPVFKETIASIGENEIPIPSHFYKTLLVYNDSIQQGIAYLLPHKKITEGFKDYCISIDSLEIFTSLDFYPSLPDRQENLIEKQKIDPFYPTISKTN